MEGKKKWFAIASVAAMLGIGWWLSRPVKEKIQKDENKQNQRKQGNWSRKNKHKHKHRYQGNRTQNQWFRNMTQEQQAQREAEKQKFLQVLQEIKKILPTKMANLRKEAQQERRVYFQKDPLKYRQVVIDFTLRQAQEMDRELLALFQDYDYNQNLFETMVRRYMYDLEIVQAVQTLSKDIVSSSNQIPPNLTIEKFEEILRYQTERFEQLAKEESLGGERAITYCNTLILDEIEDLHGFSEDQINAAIFQYTSPLGDKKFQSYLDRIRKETYRFINSGY